MILNLTNLATTLEFVWCKTTDGAYLHLTICLAVSVGWSTPPSYCYKHEPRQTGRGGGVATIYSDILNVTQKTGYSFNSFKICLLNITLSDMLHLALYRQPGPYTDFLK